ncbi:MAG: Glu-tRNA(Gln) amidotransferase subunit GatD [Candidatus Pacearchaeota archaeon]|nr:Glu-tRNA(Gln) amidotransferase subunit GatD [Candidatus Pacearchaeota archaeon]
MVELNFNKGDYVRLRLALEEIDGQVLESPESDIVLLKLKSGYNIGIKKENILGARVLRKYNEEKAKFLKREERKELPSIGLIITGGTIASKASQATGGVKPITDVDEFLNYYPELLKIVNIKKLEIPFMVFSENMTSEHWIKIAECAEKMLNDDNIKGIIITHGTDTLGYSAAALSFFLRNLNKPVVLTYAQRSIDRASSDASLNLQCAARMAISDCAEVVLVGHANVNDNFCYAIRGTRARKLHSSRRDAFKSVNEKPIAKVWKDKIEFISQYKRSDENRKVELDLAYSDKVALLKFYPGQDSSILDYYALKYKGLVIEGFGLGQINESWIPKLKKHIKNGLVICMTSQTIFGEVNPYVYSSAREIERAGVIYLGNMLAETAFVKLGWVLGHYGWKMRVREKMLENFAGEISERIEFERESELY